ncbi:MAG TPA: lysylphosphatidylglycerol synthase transmembrane domain-containing protein [Thermomicrobiales bacterium]|nr:lysylphosphatidylglycerol synthase transmembrane domain-containing protein [Thermomicrobiales bacterium]
MPTAPPGDPDSSLAIRHSPFVIQLRRWAPRLLGLALFAWVLVAVGPGKVWAGLRQSDPRLLAPAVLLAVPFIYVKGWRWARVLAGLDIALPVGAAFWLYAIGIWLGQATPGQAGDFAKAWYLRARGAPLARALLSALLDRLFDFAALFALGAVALAAFAGAAASGGSLAVALVALALVVAALAAAMTARWRAPLLAAAARVTPRALRARLARSEALRSLADARLDARHLAPVLGLTLGSWVISLTRVYLAFRAAGVDLPVADFLAIAVLITIAGLISIGGVGTRDVALVVLLAPYGYGGAQALAVSFLILALNVSNIVPGFLVWMREPLPARRDAGGEEGPA